MKIAVMQPYFFPYSGYFSLIDSVDHFMFFDDVQFIRKSWMNRNRILNIEKNDYYFIRPEIVKPPFQALLPSVRIEPSGDWKIKLFEQLKGYKNRAPFYIPIRLLVEEILDRPFTTLVEFNCYSVMKISEFIGLSAKFDKYTNHDFWFEPKPDRGTWGLEISRAMGASSYINSPGGENFILPEKFKPFGIKLGFIKPKLLEYNQFSKNFFSGLSILDTLLFLGKDGTLNYIKNYNIEWKN